jgi:hypothetical protein
MELETDIELVSWHEYNENVDKPYIVPLIDEFDYETECVTLIQYKELDTNEYKCKLFVAKRPGCLSYDQQDVVRRYWPSTYKKILREVNDINNEGGDVQKIKILINECMEDRPAGKQINSSIDG